MAKFQELGYSVVRSAGSGVNSISPDIIVIKDGVGFSFECKAWDKSSLNIEPDKHKVLVDWQRNTRMHTFIAWRMNNMGWFFIKPEEMNQNEKSFTVTKKQAVSINRLFGDLINLAAIPNSNNP